MLDTTAQIDSGGVTYLCDLSRSDVAVTLTGCLPVLTEAQTDRLLEAQAEVARLSNTLAAVEEAQAEELAAAVADAEAAQAAKLSAQEATIDELVGRVAALEAELAPFLAADASAAADEALRDQIEALARASGDLTRLIDADVIALASAGLKATAASFGTPCQIGFTDVEKIGERELQRRTYQAIFAEMGMAENIFQLILSQQFDSLDDTDSPKVKFRDAINASDDFELRDRGSQVRLMVNSNFKAFERRFDELVTGNPDVLTLDRNAGVVALANCP